LKINLVVNGMTKEYSHECIVCGRGYNSCFRCEKVESWRNICCSVQCFQKYLKTTEDKPDTEVREEIKNHQEKNEIKKGNSIKNKVK